MKISVAHASAILMILGSFSVAEDLPGAAAIGPSHPYLPDGHDLVAHFHCGGRETKVEENDIGIELIRGQQRGLPEHCAPVLGEAFDSERVEFLITNLDAASEYVFGFTWWDDDLAGRRQSVSLGAGEPVQWTEVLPPALPLAFHGDEPTYARIQLPVPADALKSGQMRLAFDRHSGSDVAVNEVWVLRRGEEPPRKRVVIVTGDDWTGHHWRGTGPELASIIRGDPRLEVSIVESPAIFASPLINHYDAAVIHFKDYSNRLPLDDEVWKGLDSYVADGHGLVIAHFGCGAFQEWSGYVQVAGRVWDPEKRGHDPYGPFHVQIADDSHAISHGMKPFDATDELYTCLVGDPKIQVLFSATSVIDQQVHPMGFVVSGSPGRVFHSSLGHDVAALRGTGTIELYRRGVAWAAGLPHVTN